MAVLSQIQSAAFNTVGFAYGRACQNDEDLGLHSVKHTMPKDLGASEDHEANTLAVKDQPGESLASMDRGCS